MTKTTFKGDTQYLRPLIGFKHENSLAYANMKFASEKAILPSQKFSENDFLIKGVTN